MTQLHKLLLQIVSLTLVLPNVRSSRKHATDTLKDTGLVQNDFLALPEILLKQEENFSSNSADPNVLSFIMPI